MAASCTHDYLFALTEKAISDTLYDVGTARNRCASCLGDTVGIDISGNEHVFTFFEQAGLLSKERYDLSAEGKALFEVSFIFPDKTASDECLARTLLRDPAVNILCQSFYGRGKVGVEQLRVLFNYHGIGSQEVTYSDVVSLLTLLNRYGIVVYDKRNKAFTVKKIADNSEPISQYYISPDTPYSNVYNMRKVLRSCKGDVYWIDKHFRKEGFEMLLDGLPYEGVTSITIISGTDNLTSSAKADYLALRSELSNRSISLSWRTITDSAFKWHDRWLVADNQCHNIPPVLAIIRGQRSEILQTMERLDVQPFIDVSSLVV